MKSLYEAYRDSEKLAPLVREIAWSHNLIILERCSDPLEREFYIRMTKKFGWSKNVPIHEIENQSYEKMVLGQTNFDRELTPELRAQAKLAIGIILCKEKKRTIVEYTLSDAIKPIGVATYRIFKKLPDELKGQLPSPEEIVRLLEEG